MCACVHDGMCGECMCVSECASTCALVCPWVLRQIIIHQVFSSPTLHFYLHLKLNLELAFLVSQSSRMSIKYLTHWSTLLATNLCSAQYMNHREKYIDIIDFKVLARIQPLIFLVEIYSFLYDICKLEFKISCSGAVRTQQSHFLYDVWNIWKALHLPLNP